MIPLSKAGCSPRSHSPYLSQPQEDTYPSFNLLLPFATNRQLLSLPPCHGSLICSPFVLSFLVLPCLCSGPDFATLPHRKQYLALQVAQLPCVDRGCSIWAGWNLALDRNRFRSRSIFFLHIFKVLSTLWVPRTWSLLIVLFKGSIVPLLKAWVSSSA